MGILRIRDLNKGMALKQGDKTTLKFELYDANDDPLVLSSAGKVYFKQKGQIYAEEDVTITTENVVSFKLNTILPAGKYYIEFVVDDKVFPSQDVDTFHITSSVLGDDISVIAINGIDRVAERALALIEDDLQAIEEAELTRIQAELDRQAQEEARETAEGERSEWFGTAKPKVEESITKAEQSTTKSAEALTKSQNALNTANGIDAKATEALSKSTDADTLSKSVQSQFNQVVIDGDSSVEAAQARVDASGNTNATLKERLDKEHNEVTDSISENEIRTLSYTKYGDLWFPPDYRSIIRSKINFSLFRDFDGLVKHDYDFDQQINRYTKIYLRKHDSSNANDGLTPQTPLKTLTPAVTKAIDLDEPVSFVFMDKFAEYSVNEFQELSRLTKDYNLSSFLEKGSIFGGGVRSGFNWQRDGELFKTSRTATIEVFDYSKRKANGDLKGFKKVDTISECRNVYMSFYTDGTSVWINYDIESGVSREIGLNLLVRQEYSLDFSGKKVNMDGLSFLGVGKTEGSLNALKVTGDTNSEVYINKGFFRNASLNGLATINIGKLFVFDSVAIGNGVDGFNYHGQGSEFVFEYNVYGSDGGTPEQSSSNATTAHDGMMIVRVGTIGENCRGPLLADVNGCVSINYDVRMYNSLLPSGKSKAAFYGSDSGADSPGEMWLINCEGGGDDTYTLYYPDLPNSKSVKVINLKGLNIEEDTKVEYIQ